MWIIITQVIDAMIFLYKLKIGYKDIKPSNILIHETGMIKICDYNISKMLKADGSLRSYE